MYKRIIFPSVCIYLLCACGGGGSAEAGSAKDSTTRCLAQYNAALCVCSTSEEEQRQRGEVSYATYGGFVKVGSALGDINIVEIMEWQDILDDPIPSGVCVPVRSKDWKPSFSMFSGNS